MIPDIDETPLLRGGRTRVFLFYAATVCAAVAAFFVIRSIGERLQAPAGTGQPLGQAAGQTVDTVFHALLALALIVVTARIVGALFSYIGQPAVIGEVVGGILLGPSLLGGSHQTCMPCSCRQRSPRS